MRRKNIVPVLFPLIVLFIALMACKTNYTVSVDNAGEEMNDIADSSGSRLKITINSKTFTTTLLSNATIKTFKARLPMTIVMSELNGNEKLHNFSANLPTNSSNPGTIQIGDLMIYGSSTLVLFYKSFPTSYSYTRLGQIDNTTGLAAAVGSGNVTVTFEQE